MHQHPDLDMFDSNLIIHLLHTSVDYNYFSFVNHTFQQIKGTSMGSAFPPTIANIFMPKLINNFVEAQHTQPLLQNQFIDDILIWTDTINNLFGFVTTFSIFVFSYTLYTSVLIAHSGLRRPHCRHITVTNLLDTITYQNPSTYIIYTTHVTTKSTSTDQQFKVKP